MTARARRSGAGSRTLSEGVAFVSGTTHARNVRTKAHYLQFYAARLKLRPFQTTVKLGGDQRRGMNFLNQLLRGISFIPALVSGIEGLLGGRSGADKKDAAMSFLENAIATVDAVAAREIVNPEKFREGISKIIDGTVQCLNASTWAKGGTAPAGGSN